MSSLYGAGHSSAQTAAIANLPVREEHAITRKITDTKLIEAYVRREFSNTPILVEIARCESTFRQFDDVGRVLRGKVNKADIGVMQINEMYHSEAADKLGTDIYSVEGNVAFAKYLYKKYGTSPWSSSSKCWSASAANLAKK